MPKLSAPNPAIFTTDPIEQVFARGATNRDNTAGLNASYLLAFGADRNANQDKYIGALSDANRMDAQLAQQEAILKMREQGMKSATDLIKEGFMPSSMQSGGDLFSDINGGDAYAKMLQALTQSKIAANYAKGAGGAGGKDQTTETRTVMVVGADGKPYYTTIASRSQDPNKARLNADTAMAARPTIGGANTLTLQQVHDAAMKRQPGAE